MYTIIINKNRKRDETRVIQNKNMRVLTKDNGSLLDKNILLLKSKLLYEYIFDNTELHTSKVTKADNISIKNTKVKTFDDQNIKLTHI